MRFSVVRVTDLVLYVCFPAMFGALMAGVSLTVAGTPVLRVVGWNVFALACVLCSLTLYRRANLVDVFRFRTRQKVLVGWTHSKYAVLKEDVEAVIESTLIKLEAEYSGARFALAGCVILFREPSWISLSTLRRVSGEQDGLLLTVGWKKDLSESDLPHEIAHRVLQVCADDPEEAESHRIIARFKL